MVRSSVSDLYSFAGTVAKWYEQFGSTDCGLLAIAYAVDILHGISNLMLSHLF